MVSRGRPSSVILLALALAPSDLALGLVTVVKDQPRNSPVDFEAGLKLGRLYSDSHYLFGSSDSVGRAIDDQVVGRMVGQC